MNAEILVKRGVKEELLHELNHKKKVEEWNQIRETVKQLKDSGKDQKEIEKEMAGKLDEDEVDSLLQSFESNLITQIQRKERTWKEMLSMQ